MKGAIFSTANHQKRGCLGGVRFNAPSTFSDPNISDAKWTANLSHDIFTSERPNPSALGEFCSIVEGQKCFSGQNLHYQILQAIVFGDSRSRLDGLFKDPGREQTGPSKKHSRCMSEYNTTPSACHHMLLDIDIGVFQHFNVEEKSQYKPPRFLIWIRSHICGVPMF